MQLWDAARVNVSANDLDIIALGHSPLWKLKGETQQAFVIEDHRSAERKYLDMDLRCLLLVRSGIA